MAVYLVQHGKSHDKDVDPDRSLTDEGIADINRIAEVASGYKVNVNCIRHSGKKRALQTAEIFAKTLKPANGLSESPGLNPNDDVTNYVKEINHDNLMIVGHLPFMEKLCSYLILGSTEKTVFQFQNGGIVCLDKKSDSDFWIIKWTLMPNIG